MRGLEGCSTAVEELILDDLESKGWDSTDGGRCLRVLCEHGTVLIAATGSAVRVSTVNRVREGKWVVVASVDDLGKVDAVGVEGNVQVEIETAVNVLEGLQRSTQEPPLVPRVAVGYRGVVRDFVGVVRLYGLQGQMASKRGSRGDRPGQIVEIGDKNADGKLVGVDVTRLRSAPDLHELSKLSVFAPDVESLYDLTRPFDAITRCVQRLRRGKLIDLAVGSPWVETAAAMTAATASQTRCPPTPPNQRTPNTGAPLSAAITPERTTMTTNTSTCRTLRAVVAAVIAVALLTLPTTAAADEGFADVSDDSTHGANIHTLDHAGTFEGTLCGRRMFCPSDPLSRAHMAVWLVRVVDGSDPDPVTATRFSDVDGAHPQAAFIERFAQLGVTEGCTTEPLRYCPDQHVTRAQMASFLARAFNLAAAGESAGFADVAAGGTHSANIDTIAATEITVGCDTEPFRYCPRDPVKRAQMASFLVRADAYVQAATDPEEPESLWQAIELDVAWVEPYAGHVPEVHPDTPTTSWERGTHRPGSRPDDVPRRSAHVQAWLNWCGDWHGCNPLAFQMLWALDYLGAHPACVVQQYEWRAYYGSQPGVTDGYNNTGLRERFGWHRCSTVIDPIQPNGHRLLSEQGLTMAERCRAMLPADAELDARISDLSNPRRGELIEGLDCDEWGSQIEGRHVSYPDCDRSARLAEEWLEHHIGMPLRYTRISC